jgi:translocation protein SEC62
MANTTSQPQTPTPEQIAQLKRQVTAEASRRGMTVEQFQAQQRAALEAEAAKNNMTLEQYVVKLKEHGEQLRRAGQQGHNAGALAKQQQKGQHVHINPTSQDPRAVALAKWLRTQNLKTRTCILNGERKDLFRGAFSPSLSPARAPPLQTDIIAAVKRALRAIESPAYAKAASAKNSLLPPVTPSMPAAEIFKLLPLSFLALRVSKLDPEDEHEGGGSHAGHSHGRSKPAKRAKGLWTVKVEKHQEVEPDLHYVFLYEGSQLRTKLYAAAALLAVFAVVLFPLWPFQLRLGVWYLSIGLLCLILLLFAVAIVRLILFVVTVFAVPPGLWLFPNLFEDVGFFDSFKPVWAWQAVSAPLPLPPLSRRPPEPGWR